ncbi:potassium channel family protein [Paraburkholderia sp. CNPSo 3076]|uniref:potassium channel family protein n=1 Tax=Paraburkholderia sp. CNPSo 3076 TaxID=2940936 RepID=UPI002258A271|nr:potassium channel family protein [Paraburkholderia sp. CNPSo 3076]MCX5543008.1 potassium channel family protein [Paraburkholderia sp. CNPSo 3076]
MNNAPTSADHAPKAREILLESSRTIWYMRLLLGGLLLIFVVLTIGMFYFGGAVETLNRSPSPMGETVYFCAITALTIGYGDVVPTTAFGRIDAVLLGLIGLVFTGLIVAAAVRGVQEASRHARNRA